MEKLVLNETPVRTSENFNINNIKLENIDIPEKLERFKNLEITNISNSIEISENTDTSYCLEYGINEILENQVRNDANSTLTININENNDLLKNKQDIELKFKLNSQNKALVENIQIIANNNSKAKILIKYESDGEDEYFHNGIIKLIAKENSSIEICVVNLININSNNFLSIENTVEDKSNVKYKIVDFGGKNSITNYYSNLIGKKSNNTINTIYIGKEKQVYDMNYIANLKGEMSNINIEVQGALKDYSKKHFKGTIDFKKGCKKSTGDENESCMLLSDTAKSIALPMLLCSEEDVEGNHSSSAGKIGEKELFYLMSRGFTLKEAMKLMVRAKFNTFLENIEDVELKNQISYEIDKRLD